MLIDSHCHLDMIDHGEGGMAGTLKAAHDVGVGHMLCVSVTLDKFSDLQAIAGAYPHISLSVGTHPVEQDSEEPTFERLVALAQDDKVVAVGETGLDYFHCKGDVTWQQERFITHIEAAKAVGKPIIVHTRDAREDTISIMQENAADKCGGVMHCFTETQAMADAAIEMGFYISFSGIITFKNAQELRDVVKSTPLSQILIETDSPYLAPVPYRGKGNQPAYVKYVAEKVAEVKDLSVEEVCQVTTENFERCFPKACVQKA